MTWFASQQTAAWRTPAVKAFRQVSHKHQQSATGDYGRDIGNVGEAEFVFHPAFTDIAVAHIVSAIVIKHALCGEDIERKSG